MRAVAYSRVSTDAQERDGTSLETQERACVERAEAEGWTVVRRISDSCSGATLDRPGLSELRELLRVGAVDVVVAYAVDRLARDQMKMAVLFDEVYEAGARLEIVTEPFEDSSVGRLIMSLRSFAAELEREKIAERTTRGKRERARSGRIPQATGRGMYGYVYDPSTGTRSVNEEQAAVVLRIFEEFVERRSCNGIAQRLNAEGVPAFAGGRWHPLTVRRMLLNEAYTGRQVFQRTRATRVRNAEGRTVRRVVERDPSEWIEVPDATPPIVTSETFERARRILADPERRLRVQQVRRYALGGRVRCGECGAAMTGHTNGRTERGYRYYRCTRGSSGPGETRCSSRYVRADVLEQVVRDEVPALLASPRRLLAEVRRSSARGVSASAIASLQKQLAKVEDQRRRLVDLYVAASVDRVEFDARSRDLEARAAAFQVRLDEVGTDAPLDLAALRRDLPDALRALRHWVTQAEGDDLDLLLRALDITVVASTEGVVVRGAVPVGGVEAGFSVDAAAG